MKNLSSISKNIDQYKEEIYKKNCKNFTSVTLVGSIITGIIVLISFIFSSFTEFKVEHCIFFVYMLFLYFISKIFNKYEIKNIKLAYYLAITPIMIIAILMGTFLDKTKSAITIIVLMNTMTLFIIDKPIRIFLYTTFIAILFCTACFFAKERELFITDVINVLMYTCIGVGVNIFMLTTHVESIKNYCLLQYRSERDSLTSLYNRGTGENIVQGLLKNNKGGAFAMIDIDDFKTINDSFGHHTGDNVLCKIATILKESFSNNDVIYRLGGDELAIYIDSSLDIGSLNEKFNELLKNVGKIKILSSTYKVGISIGCSKFNIPTFDFEYLYKYSDKLLYQAKKKGKNQAVIKEIKNSNK